MSIVQLFAYSQYPTPGNEIGTPREWGPDLVDRWNVNKGYYFIYVNECFPWKARRTMSISNDFGWVQFWMTTSLMFKLENRRRNWTLSHYRVITRSSSYSLCFSDGSKCYEFCPYCVLCKTLHVMKVRSWNRYTVVYKLCMR